MLDSIRVRRHDPENMLDQLIGFPDQCAEAVKIVEGFQLDGHTGREIRNIVIAGMGGSGIGGDLVKAVVADNCPIPVAVHRDYSLPAFVGQGTLFIAVSFSGNTEETLMSVETAYERGAVLIAITGGGKLAEFAAQRGIPCLTIPARGQPRSALGYLYLPVLAILERLGFVQGFDFRGDIQEAIHLLSRLVSGFQPDVEDNRPKQLARQMCGKLPIIYAPQALGAVAIRWTAQINENAKSLAYHNLLPEMNHNEIEGWKFPPDLTQRCFVVMLRDDAAHNCTQRRMEITAELIEWHTAGIAQIYSQGESLLARLLSLIAVGDWTSLYLAVLYAQDPTPVVRIQELKRRLQMG